MYVYSNLFIYLQGFCKIREFREIRKKSGKCVIPKKYQGKSVNVANSSENEGNL